MKKLKKMIRENPDFLRAGIIGIIAFTGAFCLYISDNSGSVMTNENGQKILKRGQRGEDSTQRMKVRIGDSEEQELDIPVAGKEYSDSEVQQVFEQAAEDMEELILGENDSLDEVRHDLNLITEIPERGLMVAWEIEPYEVMDITGKLQKEALTENGTQVKLTAVLSYGEQKAVHEFYARVFLPALSQEEQLIEELQKEIAQSDQQTRMDSYLVLPQNLEGQEVQWEYGTNTRAFAVLVLGVGAAVMILVSGRQREKEKAEREARQMRMDYPQIINKFNLYIRAGMTIRRAWFCIVQDYEKNQKGKPGRKAYEEMAGTMHQIQGGVPEAECYENYGARCGIAVYRKFGLMLAQNLRKGPKGLTDILEREAQEAFEERKNLARKLGEEAETKLMIPLFLMLIIVFAIVIVPAFFSIQI